MDVIMHKHQAFSLCRQYINQHVQLTNKDGKVYKGFIENVDQDTVYLAVPKSQNFRETEESSNGGNRQIFGYPGGYYDYGYPSYGYGGYGYGYGYGYPSYDIGYGLYPRRRFRRLGIPLAILGGIALSRLFY